MAARVSLPSAEFAWRRPAERSQWLRPIEAARIARALRMRVVVKPDGTVEFDGIAPHAQFQQKAQHHAETHEQQGRGKKIQGASQAGLKRGRRQADGLPSRIRGGEETNTHEAFIARKKRQEKKAAAEAEAAAAAAAAAQQQQAADDAATAMAAQAAAAVEAEAAAAALELERAEDAVAATGTHDETEATADEEEEPAAVESEEEEEAFETPKRHAHNACASKRQAIEGTRVRASSEALARRSKLGLLGERAASSASARAGIKKNVPMPNMGYAKSIFKEVKAQEQQARVQNIFYELRAAGHGPNEAAAMAIERATGQSGQ